MHHVRFAGLGLSWDQKYAQIFSSYLHEIGYVSKAIDIGGSYVVAYSYKPFSIADVHAKLKELLEGASGGGEEDKEEPPSEEEC